ncbi:MAG: DnaB-like helicase N-terminal domain-containing protein [Gemmatimonadaceae bacterium]|nr:DnaB-like helicase N-terminal domain-containing protein [Gemmatimonadaceae bacterium]
MTAPKLHRDDAEVAPPYSEDAEQAVLSAMLMDAEAVLKAMKHVDESAFYREPHKRIFRAIASLSERGDAIDPITLAEELTRAGELGAAGGKDYIGFLEIAVPTSANVEYHAKIVRKKALRREAIRRARQLIAEAEATGGDPAAALQRLRELSLDDSAREDDVPVIVSLAVLVQQPELLLPPPCIVPRLAHRGRATLIVAPDKAGKSTMAAHAVAAISRRGYFLGEPVAAASARSLWAGIEEATGDAVRRFSEMDAVPENIDIVVIQRPDLFAQIRARLSEHAFDVLVVDSLTEYARVVQGKVPEEGDSSGWNAVVRPLVALTREFPSLCLLMLHHPRRSDGQFRGSGEIAAAFDCLLEMRGPKDGEDPTIRHITGRARWQVPPFDVRFRNGRYELASGLELSLDARVLIQIEQNRGVSLAVLRAKVGGRGKVVDDAVTELLHRGAIVDLGVNGKHAYHPAGPQRSVFDIAAGSPKQLVPKLVPASSATACPSDAARACPTLSGACPVPVPQHNSEACPVPPPHVVGGDGRTDSQPTRGLVL